MAAETDVAADASALELRPDDLFAVTDWTLEEIFEGGSERLSAALEGFDRQTAAFAEHRETIDGSDAPALCSLLEAYESLLADATRLGGFVALQFAGDTQSPEVLAQRNRVEGVLARCQNRLLFFELWWQQLDDERASELLGGVAALASDEGRDSGRVADYVFHLHQWRRQAKYRLSEESEQLINLKDTDGVGAVVGLYSILTNGFTFDAELDGVEPEPVTPGTTPGMTRDELMAYAFSPNSQHRRGAYRALLSKYDHYSQVLGQMYVHRVRDWRTENMELRGFGSPIGVRNVANDVPDTAVNALLEVIEEKAGVFHRYFELKARALGTERLSRFDLYAPMSSAAVEQSIDYSEAAELVLQTFSRFDEDFAERALRVFAERHIDALPRRGKKGGAFCATLLPEMTPWVLLNYSGKLRDVATLAHELGHAVHSMMAEDHSVLTQHPCLPLAETASVFAEILVSERLLEECKEENARRELLASSIDDIYATVMRQAFFVLFERDAHDAVAEGASIPDLTEIYGRNLATQFGDAVEVDESFHQEWLGIPHIYAMPFYCYAYSFGQLLVLALYRRFREEGDAFKPGYQRLLAHGGSERPRRILEEVGVDMDDRDFWRGGFTLVEERIAQLASLV